MHGHRRGDAETFGFVELSPEVDRDLMVAVVREAYRASRAGTVILALRSVDVAEVNRILDDAVASVGTDVPGVQFLSTDDPGQDLIPRAASANLIIVTSEDLAADLDRRGLPHLSADDGLAALRTVGPH